MIRTIVVSRFTRVGPRWQWLFALTLCGCQAKEVQPVQLANELLGPMTIAVAPVLNVSGSADFDPNRVADLMASELSHVAGVDVIGVNRVLAVLADQGSERVESPEHALKIATILGADAVLVVAITEYDAYDPPVVGISAQLYGKRRGTVAVRFDPIAESRNGRPGGPRSVRGAFVAPLASSQRVFDASHERVRAGVQRFAESRSADAGPFGWRKYIASQQHYIRYCCYETIRALMSDSGGDVKPGTAG